MGGRNKILPSKYFEIEGGITLDRTSKMCYIQFFHSGALSVYKSFIHLPSGCDQIIVQVFILHVNEK